jgi:hypothetical protein
MMDSTVMTFKNEEYDFKILVIGDPHFKADNGIDTGLMALKIVEAALRETPDFIVVLGDVLHTHDLLRLDPVCRAITFLQRLRDISPHLYILIGNHDRPNNACYLTSEHPFTALKDWPHTTVVDQVITRTHTVRSTGKVASFTFVPYVPVGRFEEALLTVGLSTDPTKNTAPIHLKQMSGVFAHQEFKGAKMGAIISEAGDPWPMGAPLCVSGHIHDYDELLYNLVYPGTPIQHGYADKPDKTISVFHFKISTTSDPDVSTTSNLDPQHTRLTLTRHQRITLGVPSKIHIRLSPEQLATYTPPVSAHVKITVEGDPQVIRSVLLLEHVKNLTRTHGIKIMILDTRKSINIANLETSLSKGRSSMPFRDRLSKAVSQEDPQVQKQFSRLFGGNPILNRSPNKLALKVATPNFSAKQEPTPTNEESHTSVLEAKENITKITPPRIRINNTRR